MVGRREECLINGRGPVVCGDLTDPMDLGEFTGSL